jgi:hypothetical protein
MTDATDGRKGSDAAPLPDRVSLTAEIAEPGVRARSEGGYEDGWGAAWRPALRWVGLALVMVALVAFFVGQHQPDTSGCDVRLARAAAPGDPTDYVHVEACGELVFEGSRNAAEEFLRRAEAGTSTAAYTAGAAVSAGAGAVLIAIGNLGAPVRRRVSTSGRLGLAVSGGAAGFAAGIAAAAVVITPLYSQGLLMYGSDFAALAFLVPAYAILGVVFGAVYRPVPRGTFVPARAARQPSGPATTNRWAVGGFACSLVGLPGALWLGPLSAVLFSLPGIVLGVLGATKSAALPAGRGLAWWAVGLGAVGILGSAVFLAVLL